MRAWLQVQSECSYGLKAAARLKGPLSIDAEQQVSSETGSRDEISKWSGRKKSGRAGVQGYWGGTEGGRVGGLLTDFCLGNSRLQLSCGFVSLSWQNTLEPEWRATGGGGVPLPSNKEYACPPPASGCSGRLDLVTMFSHSTFLPARFTAIITVKPWPHLALQLSVNSPLLASTRAAVDKLRLRGHMQLHTNGGNVVSLL